jgi:hypothetical protein
MTETKQQSKHGGRRTNAGRKKQAETISTGFRINAKSLITCRKNNIKLNSKINEFVMQIANELN